MGSSSSWRPLAARVGYRPVSVCARMRVEVVRNHRDLDDARRPRRGHCRDWCALDRQALVRAGRGNGARMDWSRRVAVAIQKPRSSKRSDDGAPGARRRPLQARAGAAAEGLLPARDGRRSDARLISHRRGRSRARSPPPGRETISAVARRLAASATGATAPGSDRRTGCARRDPDGDTIRSTQQIRRRSFPEHRPPPRSGRREREGKGSERSLRSLSAVRRPAMPR